MIIDLIYVAWRVHVALSIAHSNAARFHLAASDKLYTKIDAYIRAAADAEVRELDLPMRTARVEKRP